MGWVRREAGRPPCEAEFETCDLTIKWGRVVVWISIVFCLYGMMYTCISVTCRCGVLCTLYTVSQNSPEVSGAVSPPPPVALH